MNKTTISKPAQGAKPDFVTDLAALPKSANEKSPGKEDRKTPFIIAVAISIAIALMGAYFLIVNNSDTLFMAQGQSFFTTDDTFLDGCMKRPGGLVAWAASFMTQFFYHPALGGAMMIAIWIISMWISKVAFKVNAAWMAVLAMPIVCLLVSMVDNGYWIYYMKQTGFWYYATIGYFCAMVVVLLYSFTRKVADCALLTLITAFTYPFLGWYTLLALVYAALMIATRKTNLDNVKAKIAKVAMPAVAAIAMPLLMRSFYPELRDDQMWTSGLHFFQNSSLTSWHPQIPFLLMAAMPLLFPFLPKHDRVNKKESVITWGISIAIIGLATWWVDSADFKDYNYHAEMRMYRAADDGDWDRVLYEMGDAPDAPTREMVLLKNIALFNKDELGNKMFRYNNMSETPSNGFDTLHIHLVENAGELLYYYHGKTNFAIRWGVENSVEYGYSFNRLKVMARCALINNEMDLAKKYLTILSTSIFYKDWAERLMPITDDPKLLKSYHEFDRVKELWSNMGSLLDGDNGLCEMYLLNYFSHTINKDSKPLAELTLIYAMVQKDIQLFWPRFFVYAQQHEGEKMPTHYQEAAYLYGNLEPGSVNTNSMPFDQTVKDRYAGFQQMSQSLLATGLDNQQVGEAMKAAYGDTFYWFYFFCRDVKSY